MSLLNADVVIYSETFVDGLDDRISVVADLDHSCFKVVEADASERKLDAVYLRNDDLHELVDACYILRKQPAGFLNTVEIRGYSKADGEGTACIRLTSPDSGKTINMYFVTENDNGPATITLPADKFAEFALQVNFRVIQFYTNNDKITSKVDRAIEGLMSEFVDPNQKIPLDFVAYNAVVGQITDVLDSGYQEKLWIYPQKKIWTYSQSDEQK